MPTISVIIPTWNRAGTIEAAIRSVLAQTLSSLEVLVCDDASSDNTKEIVLAIDDPRVIWVEGPRGGRPAIPRNRGIAVCKGEWLAFLDSDDEWLPDKLEKQLTAAKALNCKAASSNAHRLVPEEGIKGVLLSWDKKIITISDLLEANQVICSSALIHRSLLDYIVGFPEEAELRALEDYALWLRVVTRTDFAYVNEPLVIYRDDPVNSVRKNDPDFWTQQKAVLENVLRWASRTEVSDDAINEFRRRCQRALWRNRFNKLKGYFK